MNCRGGCGNMFGVTARVGTFVSCSVIAVLLSGCAGHPSGVQGKGVRGPKPFAAKVRDVLDAPTRLEILTVDPMPREDGTVRRATSTATR